MATARSTSPNRRTGLRLVPAGLERHPAFATKLPAASTHSEKACTAVLRSGPLARDPWLGVVYRDRQVQMELRLHGEVLWSDEWQLEVRRNGRRVKPLSEWEEVLWVSDERADYLELAAPFSEAVRVERQILLAQDKFLFLADAIVAQRPATLDYRACLPLADGIRFDGVLESREGVLATRRRRAMVLPLALPEWRASPGAGSLAQTEEGLELCHSADARAMYCPLFVDLQPSRFRRPLTWRQLTVGENLAAQPADVAVGFRVQVSRQQWLIYRSLAAKANRTLLGHNLATEMLVARFQRTGEVEALLEIE